MPVAPAARSPARRGLFRVLSDWLRSQSNAEAWVLDASADAAVSLDGSRNASIRVLVVDDCPVNLMVISAQLAARGLSPVTAKDGAEAVALACDGQFDLILMDLQMPVLGGLEATAAIRRFEAARARSAVPIVAFTSSLPVPEVLASHGMSGSLTKPCSEQELEECLLQWCPAYDTGPAPDGAFHVAGVRPVQDQERAAPSTSTDRRRL